MNKYHGRIVKGIGGFYYVDTAVGVFECRARGTFRKEKISPLVGDMVEISIDDVSGTGAIDVIDDRKNVLLRPPVANVTQIAIVIATANPRPNLYLLDKLIAMAESIDVEPLICWNKTDIESGEEEAEIYQKAGFDTLRISAETGEGIDALKEKLSAHTTVFAGNSGVGKSSILNRILGDYTFETGEVSKRAERGKHTTRHAELVALAGGGYIIDTPGFGSFDASLLNIEADEYIFREFLPYTEDCFFRDCSHTVEKGCGVLKALEEGRISKSRHESYCRLMEEKKSSQKWK